MEKKNKKWVWIGGIVFVLAFIGYLNDPERKGGNADTPQQSEQVANNTNQEQKQEIKEREQEKKEEKKEVKITGTYEVTDNVGCTIHITLKEDETATITGVKGEGITYYCTWIDQAYYKNRLVLIEFSDTKRPYLVFDGGTSEEKGSYTTCFLSKDGWFYYDVTPETNNPEWRLKTKKIK